MLLFTLPIERNMIHKSDILLRKRSKIAQEIIQVSNIILYILPHQFVAAIVMSLMFIV